ncbi:hypothetical protein [Telluribacter sp.]|jgi:hypothetical protein|uniref:hypothetical protein n=1 Tax=Telluribacter sp. TaxID=1978767 RepID=UPI002E1600BC|nr:hypothetical protein [Telluribacter sp.]
MKIALYLVQLLSLLTLIPWYQAAQTSFLALDTIDPSKRVSAYLFVGMILSFPIIILACIWMSWKWWRKGNKKSPFVPSSLPLLIALLAFLFVNLVQ